MPVIETNNINTYYEIHGEGQPLILIHGGFVSSTMWQPQVDYFSNQYKVLTYDIRGHGKTGPSALKRYKIETLAEDLHALLENLEIQTPIICGLSLGGMIAQVYAIKYPDKLKRLILADTAASIALTFWDKLMVYVLAPRWLMLGSLRLMGVKNFINFSFWYAKYTRSKEWLGNEDITEYEKSEMLKMDKKEYLKIFSSLYDFRLQDLGKIKVPTLVLNGEYESKTVFVHAEKIKELIEDCEAVIISNAGHISNLENSEEFNQVIEDFLTKNEKSEI
ncbi:MAG: alpha/beta fold hydrolase [Candidatus Hermodarchaeota archaeon]